MTRLMHHYYHRLGVGISALILLVVLFQLSLRQGVYQSARYVWKIAADTHHSIPEDRNSNSPILTVTTVASNTPSSIRQNGNHNSLVYTVTTGASSKEFLGLLNLVETLATFQPKLTLVVWNLGLRKCQVEFLQKRMPQTIELLIKDFSFLQYPTYFRSIKGIWKPVVIKKVVDEYGAALWLDPEVQLNVPKSVKDVFIAFEQHGIVAFKSNLPSATTALVGFQNKSYNILKKWEEETLKILRNTCRYSSVLAKASCGSATVSWPDFTFKKLISQSDQKCRYLHFDSKPHKQAQETQLQTYYLSEQKIICKQDPVCVLSGDHFYNNDGQKFAAVGLPLQQNKKNYCMTHGYKYINIGEMFTERRKHFATSRHTHCNWAKFDGMLKYSQECQLVLFLDTDAIFTNFSIKADSFFHLVEAKNKQMFINIPSNNSQLNTGAILMRNSDDARAVLLATMDEQRWSKDWRTIWGYEQTALWELVRATNSSWRNVIHVSENDHTLQGLGGYQDGHFLWKPGDFIVHFAPPRDASIEIAKFMKKYPGLFT